MTSYNGSATVNPNAPEATKVCDRCGDWWNASKMRWQFEYAGPGLYNTRFLVCPRCIDKPQEQFKTIRLPADPLPIRDPRTEPFALDENSTATVNLSIVNGAWVITVT